MSSVLLNNVSSVLLNNVSSVSLNKTLPSFAVGDLSLREEAAPRCAPVREDQQHHQAVQAELQYITIQCVECVVK